MNTTTRNPSTTHRYNAGSVATLRQDLLGVVVKIAVAAGSLGFVLIETAGKFIP